ncbi:MAG: MmcQ/YjbR family DNA-binding protein [Saprospiraceae bacterium]
MKTEYQHVDSETYRRIALSFPNTIEEPHVLLTSFRVEKRKFATLDEENNPGCLLLNLPDQAVFCDYDKSIIYPVPNKFGNEGFTYFELSKVPKSLLYHAMELAYNRIIDKIATAKAKRKRK